LDTPGIGALSDKMAHGLNIRSALIEGPLNRILLLVRFERTEIMITEIKK